MQCFERRCLTYTPDNPEGWQVEAGNVGRHYYYWRYGEPGHAPPELGLALYHSDYQLWAEWPDGGRDPSDERWLGDAFGLADRHDGSYTLRMVDVAGWLGARGDLPLYADMGVEVRVSLLHARHDNDRACLLSRVVNGGADIQMYAICVTGSNDLIAFYYEEVGGVPQIQWAVPPGTVHSTRPPGAANTLGIMARGHDLWLYANGDGYGPIHHEGPLEGAAAVAIQSMSGGPGATVADFENLWIEEVH
jgi:hypothetical protein